MNAAVQNRDADACVGRYSADAVFVRHQTAPELNTSEFSDHIKRMMASDKTDMGVRRCVYENDGILVMHSIKDYPDGSWEAVLMARTKKDSKISRAGTGATPLEK